MERSQRNVVHVIAGGVAGTTGAVITCPLEVVKTRLQSSVASFGQVYIQHAFRLLPAQTPVVELHTSAILDHSAKSSHHRRVSIGLLVCLRHIVKTEGTRGLFKGLGPTLVGVAPSRAVYFGTYASAKRTLNEIVTPETHFVHICAAVAAGVSAATLTNPIWFVKTRLQLDQKVEDRLTCRECVRRIFREQGLRGFYKGLSASYFGVSETVIHLVIYEAIKAKLQQKTNHDRHAASEKEAAEEGAQGQGQGQGQGKDTFLTSDYFKFMAAGACSKTIATCIAYPHEVVRTRLRQEGSRYERFFQTLSLVYREEGHRGLYRGLATQLVRQIPNTAIVMATYETVAHGLSQLLAD